MGNITEDDADLRRRVWGVIVKHIEGKHNDLLEEALNSKDIKEAEEFYYEARCYEEVLRFIMWKERENEEDLSRKYIIKRS
jgi:hypothetical protein